MNLFRFVTIARIKNELYRIFANEKKMIVKSELEENIILEQDLWINFIATDEKRKILKTVDAPLFSTRS